MGSTKLVFCSYGSQPMNYPSSSPGNYGDFPMGGGPEGGPMGPMGPSAMGPVMNGGDGLDGMKSSPPTVDREHLARMQEAVAEWVTIISEVREVLVVLVVRADPADPVDRYQRWVSEVLVDLTAMAAQYIHADELSVVIARQLRGLSDGWRTRRWTHGSHGSLGYGAGHERRRWTRRNEEFAGQRWTGNTSRGCRRQWRNG